MENRLKTEGAGATVNPLQGGVVQFLYAFSELLFGKGLKEIMSTKEFVASFP